VIAFEGRCRWKRNSRSRRNIIPAHARCGCSPRTCIQQNCDCVLRTTIPIWSRTSPPIKICQTRRVVLPAGCPTRTLLERLRMRVILRNTVTSASRIGRLGMAWFDYGVAITGSTKTACPSPFSMAAVLLAESGLLL